MNDYNKAKIALIAEVLGVVVSDDDADSLCDIIDGIYEDGLADGHNDALENIAHDSDRL